MNQAPLFDRRQQGGRVLMRVPVEVRCTVGAGSPLEEKTHTIVVGVQGAMVRISRALETGTEIEITNRFSKQAAKFRVMWVKDRQDGELWGIGIQSLQPLEDFWGVRFPPRSDSA